MIISIQRIPPRLCLPSPLPGSHPLHKVEEELTKKDGGSKKTVEEFDMEGGTPLGAGRRGFSKKTLSEVRAGFGFALAGGPAGGRAGRRAVRFGFCGVYPRLATDRLVSRPCNGKGDRGGHAPSCPPAHGSSGDGGPYSRDPQSH